MSELFHYMKINKKLQPCEQEDEARQKLINDLPEGTILKITFEVEDENVPSTSTDNQNSNNGGQYSKITGRLSRNEPK